MLTFVEPGDNINLAARNTRQDLDKTEQQGKKCGRNGTAFLSRESPHCPSGLEDTDDNRGCKPGLRKRQQKASLKKIEARK